MKTSYKQSFLKMPILYLNLILDPMWLYQDIQNKPKPLESYSIQTSKAHLKRLSILSFFFSVQINNSMMKILSKNHSKNLNSQSVGTDEANFQEKSQDPTGIRNKISLTS